MKYYSQYSHYELFDLQESLSVLSKSNRWVKLADNLPWDRIEREYNKRLLIGKDLSMVAKTEHVHPVGAVQSSHF